MKEDEFAWLRDKNWPKVTDTKILDHLKENNSYFDLAMSPFKTLEKTIYDELKSRIKEEDSSYPVKVDQYYYYTSSKKNLDYPIFMRKNGSNEEVILDSNILSKGKSSFALGSIKTSNDHQKLAYSYDSDGSERFSIYIKSINENRDFPETILNTIGNIIWNKDSSGFFYVHVNDQWRTNKVYFHRVGTSTEEDILIYHETDSRFFLSISETASKEYLIIDASNGSFNEIHIVSTSDLKIKKVIERKNGQLYSLDHIHDSFFISINDKGRNFRLVKVVEGEEFTENNFKEIIPHHTNEYLTDFSLYKEHLVINKKINGLSNIFCFALNDFSQIDRLEFKQEIYEAEIIYTNQEDNFLRIAYSSMIKPNSTLEYEFSTKTIFTRKTQEIPSGYNEEEYDCKRIWAKSADGTEVPISIVYRKNIKRPAKLLLYAYGSYGISTSMGFRANILSLLNRGFIYAIAHVRGGDELGFEWYESAKFLNKKKSFYDFIACAKHLINQNYTEADKLAIMGGSAGGLLVGAVLNMQPELFKSAVALVPFVDVLNTMLDDSLPLTPPEYEEWGNPKNQEYHDYIKSYCPYSNVSKNFYPNILVTAGLSDPRVGYWEAAKWVEKLRKHKKDNNILLLKTEMESGHKGQSGRFKALEEIAMIYTFLVNFT